MSDSNGERCAGLNCPLALALQVQRGPVGAGEPHTCRGCPGFDASDVICTGLEEALKRKDAIIRVRNAQISALWDELHTRQPWTNALQGDAPINLASDAASATNASRYLLVIGVNTVRVSPPLPQTVFPPSCVSKKLLSGISAHK